MDSTKWRITFVAVACCALLASSLAWSQTNASNARSQKQNKDRAHTVMSQSLPALDGNHLKAFLLEVRYGPGEASPPHSHPCAVIGYVVEGSLRTQVQGQPERILESAMPAMSDKVRTINWERAGILYTRIAVGAAFLSAVASRFGLWDRTLDLKHFANFIAYAAEANSFLPIAVIPYVRS